MAHNIDMSNDRANMAYVETNGKPWHGLANGVREGATIEEIRAASGLGWPVRVQPVQFEVDGRLIVDASHQVMFRGDTLAVLDVTGKGYVPHQNDQVLDFFREYVEHGEMYIDTAGSLNGGKQIWVLAKMKESFTLPGKDKVEGYVLLMNPHQYGKGMIAKFTTIRVVCWNTLMMALGAGGASVKIWHTTEFNKARQDEAKRNLGIARERLDAFKADAKVLVDLKLDRDEGVRILARVFKADEKKPLEQHGKTINRIVQLWEGAGMGATLASAHGTGWGLLNGVTQYLDHEYGRTIDARLTNAWLGMGEVQKRATLSELLAVARDN